MTDSLRDRKASTTGIVMDPAIDFAALYREFDTILIGRPTYETMTAQGGSGAMPGLDVMVLSTMLSPRALPGVRIVNRNPREAVAALKQKDGRDIWLFGGGKLFRSVLDAALVDTVEIAVMPVLLGQGTPLLPPGSDGKARAGRSQDVVEERQFGAVVFRARRCSFGAAIRYVKPAKRQAAEASSCQRKGASRSTSSRTSRVSSVGARRAR